MIGIGPSNSLEALHGGKPVHARQADVQHDHVRPLCAGRLQALLRRGRRGDAVSQCRGQLASPQQMLCSSSTTSRWAMGVAPGKQRKLQSEAGHAVGMLPAQRAVMGLGDLPGDEQAQAGPLGLFGHEGLEQPVADGLAAGPGPESFTATRASPPWRDNSMRTLPGCAAWPAGRLDGIEDQVDQHLPQGLGVAHDGQRFRRRARSPDRSWHAQQAGPTSPRTSRTSGSRSTRSRRSAEGRPKARNRCK